jgi:hypothetical protein
MMNRGVLALGLFLFLSTPVSGQIQNVLDTLGLGKKSSLSNDKIAAGLKEALRVGTNNTVQSTGRVDGYFRNEAIKILMPEKLRPIEKGMRIAGFGPQVDELVLSMNRAAEKAAPLAKDIFIKAILEMSFDDARRIFTGGDTAATDYFKAKTSDRLAAAFAPIVDKSMKNVGLVRQYDQFMGRAQQIPFLKNQSLDIRQYVVAKALDGLFFVLGQEERNIRKNPAARVTQLLKDVFGR